MKLPNMKYLDGISKSTQVKFGGLNHTKGAGDGELWDMKNLTGDHYPLLATRAKRQIYRRLEKPSGLYSWEGLCWVDGTGFYYRGKYKMAVSEGEKIFASIGAYIVIFPDKCYYNVDTDESGSLEAVWEEQYFFIGDGTRNGMNYKASCIFGRETDSFEGIFSPGDAVTIENCNAIPSNNKTAVVRAVIKNELHFDENTFTLPDGESRYMEQEIGEGNLTIKRTVPDLKYICENENRLWGCSDNRIFSCKQGDPFNWNNRDGVESDGYEVDTGSAGIFTGCVSFQGYPTFFKEDHIYKVYGALPSEFQLMESTVPGVANGSHLSLAVANSILFYLSRNGVMAYTGGIPQSVGSAFGLQRFQNAVAGSDGMKYYISMQDGTETWGLYVYDTQTGLWFKEDDSQAVGFARHDGKLYMQTKMGQLLITGNVPAQPEEAELEETVQWFAEFADITEKDPNKKGISKLQLRLELEEGANVQVWMMLDSDGKWMPVGQAVGEGKKRSYYLPIVPRRADHYRLKLTGTGGCRIYSLTLESYSGSELRSKEGRN
ncbi:MAG: hypothetical protein E7468_01225 [Ruminococcaceae bacterium]|nr:hypothetical protein [Oscillospiraceae bacterium]